MSTRFAGMLVAFAFATPVHADDLWRHGTLVPKGDAGFIYMAAEGGFAKAQGLDLKMQAFQNDTLMMKALIAGELDTYEGSPISPLIAGSKGADVKILGCTWPKLTYSLFSHDGIGSVADLKGKKFGISAPGSLPDLVARAMLKQAGVAPSEVSFVAAGRERQGRDSDVHTVAHFVRACVQIVDDRATDSVFILNILRAGGEHGEDRHQSEFSHLPIILWPGRMPNFRRVEGSDNAACSRSGSSWARIASNASCSGVG